MLTPSIVVVVDEELINVGKTQRHFGLSFGKHEDEEE